MTTRSSASRSAKTAKAAKPAKAKEAPASPRTPDVRRHLISAGALLEGHFLLSSGLHSDKYLQAALLLADPQLAEDMGKALASVQDEVPDAVVSPAVGGIVIGQEVARALKAKKAFFAERVDGSLTLRRGFRLLPGEKVVVVEDVITTGRSAKEIVTLARSWGAKPLAVLSVAVRSLKDPEFGVPLKTLLRLPLVAYQPGDCALCRKGIPLVKPGSREFRKMADEARKR
ncbi:MAG: orotate phosphoribosyltransferase [Elusimicrobia bacterium]|nr:orotate phosphoribosyltransferase [Elusimicrobiota bacterium]